MDSIVEWDFEDSFRTNYKISYSRYISPTVFNELFLLSFIHLLLIQI